MRLFLIFFWFFLQGFAQKSKATFLEQLPLVADQFVGIDDFKNVYSITERVLSKRSAEHRYQFSDLQLGQISSVDIINPLRITVFYDQFNTVVILDNRLNEITRVNFNRLENFRNVSFARTASDRKLWIFNVDLQRLELFDYQNNKVITTSPPLSETAVNMVSNFNTCWVYTGNSLKTYNIYGSLISSSPLNNITQLHQNDGRLFAIQKDKIVYKAKNTEVFETVPLNENKVKELYYADEILYIYDGRILKSYSLKLPKN